MTQTELEHWHDRAVEAEARIAALEAARDEWQTTARNRAVRITEDTARIEHLEAALRAEARIEERTSGFSPQVEWTLRGKVNRLEAQVEELTEDVRTLEAERDQLRRELERRESGVYGEMRDELVAELEKLEAERDRYRAALREAMELHRIAVVYVLAATPRTERTDYIDRLGALEALALTTSTQEPTVRFTNEGPPTYPYLRRRKCG